MAARDGLANVFTTMGEVTGRRGGDYWTFEPKDWATLEAMYRGDWLSRKAVDIIAADMTQEWRRWQGDNDQVTAIENAERKLKLRGSVKTALKYARLYGGGAVVVSDGKAADQPLDPEAVGKGALKYTFPVSRVNLTAYTELEWRPNQPNFGQPEFYQLSLGNARQVRVHYSRVSRFIGAPYPDPSREADPWGDSILDALADAIRDAGISNAAGAQLMEEAKVDIVQMEGLENYLSTEDGQARLQKRMALIKLGKSAFRVLLMGGKETYSTKQLSLANVDKVLMHFMQIVSGATDIPATRFLSQSPAGMNSTGESDLRNYAQTVNALQEEILRPEMTALDEMLVRHATGQGMDELWYDFPTIWKMSPKEAAETNKLHSEADLSYANSGMIPTAALEKSIQTRMEDSGLYPGLAENIRELSAADLDVKRPDPPEIQLDPNKIPPGGPAPKPAAKKKPAKARR